VKLGLSTTFDRHLEPTYEFVDQDHAKHLYEIHLNFGRQVMRLRRHLRKEDLDMAECECHGKPGCEEPLTLQSQCHKAPTWLDEYEDARLFLTCAVCGEHVAIVIVDEAAGEAGEWPEADCRCEGTPVHARYFDGNLTLTCAKCDEYVFAFPVAPRGRR
jgi:hypothetical protein